MIWKLVQAQRGNKNAQANSSRFQTKLSRIFTIAEERELVGFPLAPSCTYYQSISPRLLYIVAVLIEGHP